MSTAQPLELLSIEELAQASRLVRDLANAGVCEPGELRQLWVIADRIDNAVVTKREATPETPASS